MSKVSEFAPSSRRDPSLRLLPDSEAAAELFAPFHLIATFDIFARPTLPDTSFDDALSPQYLYSFGRPMWAAYLASGRTEREVVRRAQMTACAACALVCARVQPYVVACREACEN